MIAAAFALAAGVALAWVGAAIRSGEPPADRALQVAWQLVALSFVSAPESLIGERGEGVLQVGLGATAASALGVWLVLHRRDGADGPAIPPWLAAYAGVLAVAAVFSSSPDIAALRGLRAVVLFVVVGLASLRLDRAVLRRRFGQMTAGLAVAVAVGPLVAPDQAFHPLQAPVIRHALQAPVIGSGPHVVAAIGFGLVLATAWRWLDGDRPDLGSQRWALVVGLPMASGLALVLLSQKRAFWFALVVVAISWLVLCQRRWLAPALAVLGLGAISLLAVGPLRDLWDREQARPQVDNIASVRGAIFEASLDRFAERPLIGDGLGVGNRDLLIDVGQVGLGWSSHSELGAALAATGLIGLAVVVWGHGNGLAGARTAWRTRGDPLPLMVLAGSLALLPFWRVLQEPLLIGLPYYTIVFPLHDWRPIGPIGRRLARRAGRSS